jgi:hypothetical protein
MKTLIRTAMLCLVTLVALQTSSFANGEYAMPFSFNHKTFVNSLVAINNVSDNAAKKSGARICSCQLLRVRSNNEDIKNMALYSEKINNGDVSADMKIAASVLAAERKNIRMQFFNDVKVSRTVTAMTDCSTMIKEMKSADQTLKVYDVLDADIRSQIAHK